MAKTILVVDDEADLLDMLRYNIEREGYTVFTAEDGVEALECIDEVRPDLIILDIMMPRMDGLEVCRRLRLNKEYHRVPILMLTALTEEVDEIAGLETGADDFISKPVSPRLLLSRVRALLRRVDLEEIELPPVVRVHGIVIDADRYVVEKPGNNGSGRMTLPRKQFQLLHYLAAHPGRAFSRDELLSAVWGDDVQVVPRTVDVHIRRLRKRLGDTYIETVTGVGYRFKE